MAEKPITFPELTALIEGCDRFLKPIAELREALGRATELQYEVARLTAEKERLDAEIAAANAEAEAATKAAADAITAHNELLGELEKELTEARTAHTKAMTALENERREKAAANDRDDEAARQRIAGYESREAEAKRAAEAAEGIAADAKAKVAAI